MFSSLDFERDVCCTKRAADKGPVIVTEREVPAYVLLRYDEYRRLTPGGPTIRELLDLPGSEDVEYEVAAARWWHFSAGILGVRT